GDSDGKGQKFVKLTDQSIRYDTLRLTIRDRSNKNGGEQIFEKKIKNVGASMPATCSFNLLLAEFRCDYAVLNKYGDVYFYGQKLDFPKTTYSVGDKLNLAVLAKADFGSDMGDENGQISQEKQLPKYAQLTVLYGDRVMYKETTQKDAITTANGNPIIMGASYVIANGNEVKGLGGTYEIEGSIATLNGDYTTPLPANLDDLALTRSTTNQRVYIIYDGSNFKVYTQQLSSSTNVADDKSRLETSIIDIETKSKNPAWSIKEISVKPTETQTNYEISLGTIKVSVPKNKIQSSQKYSLIATYSKLSTTSPVICPPNVDQVELIARVTLHDSKAQNTNEEPTRYNSVMNPATFTYNGEEQRIEQKFNLLCKQTTVATPATVPACAENTVLSRSAYPNDCSCGSTPKLFAAHPTGEVICHNYAGVKTGLTLCKLDEVATSAASCFCPPLFSGFDKYGAAMYTCYGTCKLEGTVNKCTP
ncbi:MAG TPA: hypothetical protein VK158_06375, partial [Acidobacteriota bacterium]|nr:hypothetical protein [Acidobacteriota bacterium]